MWPAYVFGAHARHECPAALLVLTLHRATARWAAEPIVVGPGLVLQPFVVGPDDVPVVTDARVARENPEIALL